MIYKFRITSQESKNFHLEVELDGKNTFFDLHTTIQKNLGFESHQLASFFVSDGTWRKYREISLLDLGLNGGVYLTMQKTRILDVLKTDKKQLIYTFDFINDRSLYIELTGIIMEKNLKEPTVTSKQGDAPVQVFGEEPESTEATKLQEEEVFMDFGVVDDYNQLFGEMEDI